MATGYLIIDLQNVSFTNSEGGEGVIPSKPDEPSIYEKIESNLGKALLLTNIVINGIKRPNTFTHIVKVVTDNIYLDYKCEINSTTYNYIIITPYDEDALGNYVSLGN